MSYRYFRDTLPSGLRVVTVEATHLHTAMLSVYVRTGSRHETRRDNGVSHFLEHMFFRGSERYPDTVKMNALVESVGGNLNGVTARDHGYYYTPLHPEGLDVAIDVLGDMLTHPRFPKLEVEREVILEEMLDEVDEKGRDVDLDNLSKMHLFGEHPLSLKIAGTRDSVRGLTRKQLLAHFAQHYVTGNMVVAVSGRVRRHAVLERVSRAFKAVPRGAPNVEAPPAAPPPGPHFHWVQDDEAQVEFRLNFRTVPESHPDFPALLLLRRVLDDGLSSRLPFNVVERRGLAYSVQAGMEAFHDCGLFEIEAACAPQKAPLVVEEVCRTLGTLTRRSVPREELARVQRRHRVMLDFAQDSAGELAGWFGGTELFRRPERFEQRCQAVERQTPEHLREVARRYFTASNLTVVAVGPRRGRLALQRAALDAPGLPA